jgi:hypothetical protein
MFKSKFSAATGLVLGLTVLTQCGDGPTEVVSFDTLTDAQQDRLLARAAVIALSVAVGPQGRSFFDNFLPCTRRGVADYSNTATGRRVTFSGCEVGDAIVVNGDGELTWVGPAAVDRDPFCVLGASPPCAPQASWSGNLRVEIDGTTVLVPGFEVAQIDMQPFGDPLPEGPNPLTGELGLRSLVATLGDRSVTVSDPSLPAQVFDTTGLHINSLSNPGGSLGALSEADLKRLAYHAGIGLASFLFDETLEIGRPPHTHDLGCGTSSVSHVDAVTPRIDNEWDQCHLIPGLFASGQFGFTWGEFDVDAGRLTMVLDGSLTIGGGVPTVVLTSWSWSVEGLTGFPAQIRIRGAIRAGSDVRSYNFTVMVDD